MRKKNRYRTNIRPPKTQKQWKNQYEINKNQKLISRSLIHFWLQKHPMLAPQNDQKTIKKSTRKLNKKKFEKRANIDQKTWPSCERKAAHSIRFLLSKNVVISICSFCFIQNMHAYIHTYILSYIHIMLPNGFLELKIIHISLSLPLIGCFGAALGPLLAALGPLLGRSWPLLGPSWALLGRSWALLGRSWALLGRSWNDMQKSSQNWCQKWSIWTPQRLPKGLQNRSPNRPKIDAKNDAQKEPI